MKAQKKKVIKTMTYQDALERQHRDQLNEKLFIFVAKASRGFTANSLFIIGFNDGHSIKTLGGLYSIKDFRKVRAATLADFK